MCKLSVGSSVRTAGDPLKEISVQYLYESLTHPRPEREMQLRQLRTIRQIDPKRYDGAKRMLPYFVCAAFNPAVRRTENFAYTDCFVLDLDDLSERQQDLATVRRRVEADARVMLSFVSPGEDGLKLLFRLKERCYDAGIYKLFYRAFLQRFSEQYQLEQVADSRTCDVTRACFISIDANAYFNPNAEAVVLADYIDETNVVSLFDMKAEQERADRDASADKIMPTPPTDPDSEVMKRIRETLKMKRSALADKPTLPIYVPERLELIMAGLRSFLEDQGFVVADVKDIQYGKKIRLQLGQRLAEVNLFYGKRGFSVVQTSKAILSAELNEMAADAIMIYLSDNT